MSDFQPGFTARHAVAPERIARAFTESLAPRPADAFVAVDRRAPVAPRHFHPADPDRNPTEGWDPFAAEPVREGSITDALAEARDLAYAEGLSAGLRQAAAARAGEAALADRLADALAAGAHLDRDRIATQLRQTVLHLVRSMLGEVGVDGALLGARVDAAVRLLADGAESALLRLHPDDVAAVEGRLPDTLFPVGDPHVERGGFVLESASTIVEDGPASWLAQLGAAIDQVPLPTC